jgi:hypothetical protein
MRAVLTGSEVSTQAIGVRGMKAWYSGNRFFEIPFEDFHLIANLPPSGWMVVMVYFDLEWAPGFPYRMILMGTTNFIYNPRAQGEWMFENTDESKQAARDRIGRHIVYFTSNNVENAEYWDAVITALRAETW